MPDYMPKSARPYMPRSARPVSQAPEVGAGETVINKAVGWLPAGNRIVDAGSALALKASRAIGSAAPNLSRTMSSLPVVGQFAPAADSDVHLTPQAKAEMARLGIAEEKPAAEPSLVDTYRQVRDTRAERTEAGAKQNPWAARFGNALGLGLSLAAPLPKVGTGLKGAMATGAGYGALEGLTNGSADLTQGDLGGALRDTAEGAAMGAGAGVLGHGLVRLGQRGLQALRNARGELVSQETAALREAAQEGQDQLAKEVAAHREVVGKARGMMRKDFSQREAAAADEAAALERQHGQALEANRRVDARAARSAERERRLVDRARARETAQPTEPSTRVLEGYAGKAGERKAVNYDRVQQYRRDIHNPDMDTRASSDLQRYIEEYGDAVDAPDAFRRRFIERYLRENHGDEMAERLMRERVSPDGRSILPRPASATTEATNIQDAGDWVRRGQLDRAGGGGSAWQGYGPEGKTIRALPDELPGGAPSLADEAEVAMAARRAGAAGSDVERGMAPMLPAPRPASLDAWTPNAPRPVAEPVLGAPPARRGSSPAFDVGGRPPPGFERARTRPGGGAVPQEPSMAAPVAEPLPDAATRATNVPNLRRPALPPAPEPTVVDAPVVRAAPPPASDIQDVTRLAGPDDVALLAQERAAVRERGALGDTAWKLAESLPVIGPIAKVTRETLKNPAVRARALSMAKLHLLAQINPDLFARVGGQLSAAAATGDEGRYKAQKYLAIRTHPELRVAENQAAERAGRLSDEQLMSLIAGGAPGAP